MQYSRHLEEIVLDGLHEQAISILIHSVTHVEKNIYVVVIATIKRLFFRDLSNMSSSNHKTIVDFITKIVNALQSHSPHIGHIVSDNAQSWSSHLIVMKQPIFFDVLAITLCCICGIASHDHFGIVSFVRQHARI
jgi:hypothetical protein